ncbi:MAG TPA: hypothetical protein VJG64_03665 [Candidatus Paceibacterota bacterium]
MPSKKPWISIILLILAVLSAIAFSDNRQYIEPMMEGFGGGSATTVALSPTMMEDSQAGSRGMSAPSSMMKPSPYQSGSVPITDTREFLKQSYSARMQTRDVQGLVRRAETTVRGFEGRVDQISSEEKYGYISFVIPASKFEEFRTEIESFVNSRFLKVQVSAQNLLPQKQSIEEQQKQADTTLASYQSARQSLINTHVSALKSLQADLDAAVAEAAQPDRIASIQAQIASENASYAKKLTSADSNIKYAKDWQKAVKTQDQNLLDNVATVDGSISFQWISLFDIVHTYLPGLWIPGIIAALAILAYFWERRRFSM